MRKLSDGLIENANSVAAAAEEQSAATNEISSNMMRVKDLVSDATA